MRERARKPGMLACRGLIASEHRAKPVSPKTKFSDVHGEVMQESCMARSCRDVHGEIIKGKAFRISAKPMNLKRIKWYT